MGRKGASLACASIRKLAVVINQIGAHFVAPPQAAACGRFEIESHMNIEEAGDADWKSRRFRVTS